MQDYIDVRFAKIRDLELIATRLYPNNDRIATRIFEGGLAAEAERVALDNLAIEVIKQSLLDQIANGFSVHWISSWGIGDS
ncbi:MAG: hypothetical protein QOE06_2815 [Thermoleophilaceae bacterium]|nr:hypothetical protein [Thermoleophilaceae bacterium]